MPTGYFLPSDDAGKELWLKNFAAKLPTYATKYAIPTTEVQDIQRSSTYFTFILDYNNQFKDYSKKLTEYKNEIRSGNIQNNTPSTIPQTPVFATVPAIVEPDVFGRAVAIANRIKNNLKYTTADGTDLAIESTAVPRKTVDAINAKPLLQVTLVQGGHPEIAWTKSGFDALEIHVDRSDGKGFVLCEVDIKPNYTDQFPLPEQPQLWRYKAIYRLDNMVTGFWSDTVNISVVKLQTS
jgi:hypothetical protein